MKNLIEALLFAAPEPLTQKKISAILPEEDINLSEVIDSLNDEYSTQKKAIYVGKIGGGYQILTKPEYHIYIKRLFNKSKKIQLSRAALEALAIIAYRQPISKSAAESIRGVGCDSVIRSLLEKELITVKGRESGLGRALLYGTTQYFLEAFGLYSLSDLPKLPEIAQLMKDN